LRLARHTLKINPRILLPLILVVTTFGTYAATRQLLDLMLMFLFGIAGYLMRRIGFSPIPMLIAFLLGPLLEDGIRRSLLLSGGDIWIFFQRPISLGFIALAAVSLLVLMRHILRQRRHAEPARDRSAD
jgi:putative tricarboxylic transport membrane protein